ncbi:MAG: gliding motility-associated C-terminal domain-containing protein [Bacteroidales bacterium]|nr:gliding motility-associated C-terminal domain-containing protein [Bacteroidales bacterium]
MRKTALILPLLLLLFFHFSLRAQNNLCQNSLPFCTDTVYNFPAGVNAGTAQSGAAYTCLGTQPNPAWYYMEVLNNGPIDIYMSSTPQVDIDFSCWGPFTNQTSPCVAQLTSGNTVDCSYSTAWNETCNIPNAQAGQIYILLICNYSNQPCNINFHQSNTGNPNHGTTNCGILAPPIENNGPLCEGETLEITVTNPNPNATYNWTGPNGFTSNLMDITIPNVTTGDAGTYSMTITVNGQTSPAVTTVVVVNPMPIVTLAPFQNVCGDIPDFALTGGDPAGGTYSGQGVTSDMFSPSSVGPGTYTIQYAYSTPEGCADSVTETISVADNPQIIISEDTTICVNNSVSLTASGGASYIWSAFSTTQTITVTPTSTTTYTVTVSNSIGCSSADSVVVTVNQLPPVSIKPENPALCRGESASLVAGGGTNYLWTSSPSDPTIGSQNTSPIIMVSPNTSTTYTVVVSDAYGCESSISVPLTLHPNPIADFQADPKIAPILEPIINFFDNSTGATSWHWYIEDNTHYYVPVFTHTFTDTGYYEIALTVSNQYGCMDSTFGSIYIQPMFTIYIPNTFSPNEDLKNDMFYIYGDGVTEIELRIFDRWGKLLFFTDDVHMGWDGKVNNNKVPEGVYPYRVVYRDGHSKRHILDGTVTLIR